LSQEFAITNGTVITASALLPNCNLFIASGKIERIAQPPSSIPAGVTRLDARGNYVSPGFVDVHIHGFGGYDASHGDETSLLGMSKKLTQFGTTTFLPTLVSVPTAQTRRFLESVRNSMSRSDSGARIAGAHLEGPFLNPSKRGVHRQEYLSNPSLKDFREMIRGYEGIVRILTIAPELEGAAELCNEATGLGIVAAMGHTNATFIEARVGIEAGITHSTHTFNAMSGLQSREPGAVGAVLLSDKVKAEIIADGIHLSPEIVKLVIKAKGSDGVILVTDAVTPAGTELKEFELAGIRAHVRDGGCFTEDGRICGSILTLDRAVRNILAWNQITLPEAIRMATLNPAKQIGIEERTGSLEEGKDADIVILDKNLTVTSTFVKGVQTYSST